MIKIVQINNRHISSYRQNYFFPHFYQFMLNVVLLLEDQLLSGGGGGAKVFHWKSSDNPGLPQQLCGDAYSWNFILKSSFSLMFFNLVWVGEHFFKNLSHISIAFRKHNLILISFWCYKQFNMQVTKTGDFIKMMTAFGFTVQWSSL